MLSLYSFIQLQNRFPTMESEDNIPLINHDVASEEGPVNVVKWCEDTQAKAVLEELKTEKYGLTKRERKNLKKYFGYTRGNKGEKRKKDHDQAGWYTRLALDLKSEEEEQKEEREDPGGDTPFFGHLPSIFSQVSPHLRDLFRAYLFRAYDTPV